MRHEKWKRNFNPVLKVMKKRRIEVINTISSKRANLQTQRKVVSHLMKKKKHGSREWHLECFFSQYEKKLN